MDRTAKADLTPVRQRTQYSCMSASMMMCLRALGHDVTEDEVNRVMGARPMKGAAWEQALACAQHYGCRATLTMPSTVEQLKGWTDAGIPIMIAWNPEGRPWSHASAVYDVTENLPSPVPEHCTVIGEGSGPWVWVADPNIPNPKKTTRIINEDEFYGKWYEKFPDYLVRRPACAIEREITEEGKNMRMASRKAGGPPPDAEKVPDTSFWISKTPSKSPIRGQRLQFKIYNQHGGVVGGAPSRDDAVEKARMMAFDKTAKKNRGKGKRPENAKTRAKTPKGGLPKTRDEHARARAEGQGSGGAGKHHNRKRDVAKGRSRKMKHKNQQKWALAVDRLTAHTASRQMSVELYVDGRPHGIYQMPVAPNGISSYPKPMAEAGGQWWPLKSFGSPSRMPWIDIPSTAARRMKLSSRMWYDRHYTSEYAHLGPKALNLIGWFETHARHNELMSTNLEDAVAEMAYESGYSGEALDRSLMELGKYLKVNVKAEHRMGQRDGQNDKFASAGRTVRDTSGRVWGPKRGLEGPFKYRGGEVLYYDPRLNGGTYYDPTTDMYLSNDEASRIIMRTAMSRAANSDVPEIHIRGSQVMVNQSFATKLKQMHRGYILEGAPRGGFTLVHPASDTDPDFDGGDSYDFYFSPSRKMPGMFEVAYTRGYLILLQRDGDKMRAQTKRLARSSFDTSGKSRATNQLAYRVLNGDN